MFGLGLPELAIILVVVIFILGPKKLPELGAAIARTLRGFKEEANAIEEERDRK